jgi:AsmA protein
MSFSATLSMQGSTMREIRKTAQGRFALGSESITLTGRDLDQEFSRFESSQHFNLADVGGLFFAGPFGLVVTKGYTFASLLHGAGGSSVIRKLVSEWKVEQGIAHAQDVAMATSKNRIALHGDLDLVNEQFDDVILALIDADGCVKAQQKIHGTFQNPVVENPNVFESLAGSAVNLYKQGRGLFPGGACEVFYAGSVAAPKQ